MQAQPSIVVVTPATVTASVPKSDITAEFVVVDAPPAAGPPAPAPSVSTADADIDELESFIDNL